jgi:hypothetical protein
VLLLNYLKINKKINYLKKLEDKEEARLRVEEDIAKAALLRAR